MPIRLVSPHPPPLGPYWCPLGWPRGQGVPLFAQSGTIAIQSKAGRIAVAPHDRPEYQTRPPAIAHAGQHPQPQYVRATPPAGPSTCPPGPSTCPKQNGVLLFARHFPMFGLRPGGRPGFPGGGLCIAHRQGNGVTSLVFKFWRQSSKGWWRYRASRKAGQGPSSFPGSKRETVLRHTH